MTTQSSLLNNNALAFIALSNEYCQALESARESERIPFVENMLRLLPRIYISATDLQLNQFLAEDAYLEGRLDEDFYDSVRRGVENLLGPQSHLSPQQEPKARPLQAYHVWHQADCTSLERYRQDLPTPMPL